MPEPTPRRVVAAATARRRIGHETRAEVLRAAGYLVVAPAHPDNVRSGSIVAMTDAELDRWHGGDPRNHDHHCNRNGCHTAWVDMLIHGQALELRGMEIIMADLARLDAAVTANTEATNDAVAALGSGGTDQPGVDAAAAQIEANTTQLRDAVAAGQPPTV
jgi:hypothetical protein